MTLSQTLVTDDEGNEVAAGKVVTAGAVGMLDCVHSRHVERQEYGPRWGSRIQLKNGTLSRCADSLAEVRVARALYVADCLIQGARKCDIE